jgi:hypothetical protein
MINPKPSNSRRIAIVSGTPVQRFVKLNKVKINPRISTGIPT